jgi:hypothetical protein
MNSGKGAAGTAGIVRPQQTVFDNVIILSMSLFIEFKEQYRCCGSAVQKYISQDTITW